MITKQQMRNLIKLRDYFKDIPAENIVQVIPGILKYDSREGIISRPLCGCFGAHVAKALLQPYSYTEKNNPFWLFVQVYPKFKDLLGFDDRRLYRHGAAKEPFGMEDWSKHPVEVLNSIIEEIEECSAT